MPYLRQWLEEEHAEESLLNNLKNRYQRKLNQKPKTKNSKKESRLLYSSDQKRIKNDSFRLIINLTLYITNNINLIHNE